MPRSNPTPTSSQPSLRPPVVEKIPPTMPHSRTRNCHRGMCCSLTVTISELVSYLTKMPETPWLPAAWLITRSWGGEKEAWIIWVLVLWNPNQVSSSHSLSHGELVRVCRYLVCVEFGGDNCDEILEHLVIYSNKEKMWGSNSVQCVE